ncbi:hypothetical protein ABVK25_001055 [Lepraria finkii]|uniref:Uncharacterized protein n=1 Tax=Lepraria finkii TaxID=1340010 RepID=A0ABR4BKI9_9LECA
MVSIEEQTAAMTNRFLRTIRTELEFLADSSIITPAQLSTFLSQLPSQTALHAPPSPSAPTTNRVSSPPPTTQFTNTTLNEKANHNERANYFQ